MNLWILGVALTGAALLSPCANANGLGEPAGLFEQSLDTETHLESAIAEVTAAIERTMEMVESQTGGPGTIDADVLSAAEILLYGETYGHASNHDVPLWSFVDVPAYAEEHWGATVRAIPVANWDTAVYEIPLKFELAIGAGQFAPAGFGADPMAVGLTTGNTYVPLEHVLMLQVRVRF